MSYEFSVDQDRTIDPLTVQYYCTGCPFKAMKANNRNPSSNGSTNPVPFESIGNPQAQMMKVVYECTSPNYHDDYKKRLSANMELSTIGVGYCPFLIDRWKLKESNHDPDDPPIS